MPVIFGREIPTKTLWIGGGLIAAAVAIVVWLRARAASNAAAAGQEQPASSGQGYQGTMSVPAPTQAAADQYQQQIQNSQLEAQKIANDYQRQLAQQQATQFKFQMQQEAQLAPYLQKEEAAQLGAQTHYYQTVANTRISCPGGQGVAADPATGQLYCRQKTSGGFLGLPIGAASRIISGLFEGAQAAAPSIGYQASQQAADYYLGKTFTPKSPSVGIGASGSQEIGSQVGARIPRTPGLAPTPLFAQTPPELPRGTSRMSGGALGYEPFA